MCGLFGVALEEPLERQEQLITQLALYNETRGTCSWGVYVSEGDELIKDAGPIGLDLHRIPTNRAGILMGHTRASTVGNATKENAHPFEFEGEGGVIIGAHNGSIGNWAAMNAKYEIDLKVDSMHIFHHLANKLPLSELEGYGAITFMNNDTLLMSKFNNGSLSVAHIEGNKGIVWSSEEGALIKAMKSLGVKYSTYNIVQDKIYYYEKGQLFTAQDRMPIRTYVRQGTFPGSHFDHKKSARTQKPIVVRFRILAKERLEADDDLNAIMFRIHNDTKLSTFRRYTATCGTCNASSTTRTLCDGDKPICLRCLAAGVKAGLYTSEKIES